MTLLTPWGEALDAEMPLPEYPRPQLVRGDWGNLNGSWSYAITPFAAPGADPIAVADPSRAPATWDGTIVVPFSPETPLSGVGRTLRADQTLWYRRTFMLPRPLGDDERAILHFGAVDQSCRVAVDGREVGGHTGGYLPFAFDVTASLDGGRNEHDLVVAVRDVTDAAWLSRGKQCSSPGGIWYTPQSGIWQTVWVEIVPRVAIDALVLTPHLDAGELEIAVRSAQASPADVAHVEVRAGTRVAASIDVPVGIPTRVPLGDGVHPWSPDDPFLYDVTATLGSDRVDSYVGMRSFTTGQDDHGFPRLFLNGAPHLPVGLLDQGYWPDGGYTAPSDAALEYDIALAKSLGFTMLRKHIKVEPMRWYHHCDRLGMLVWQDAVNGGGRYRDLVVTAPAIASPRLDDRHRRWFAREDSRGREQFESELAEMVEHLRNVPSISLWVPFNEGWGQFDAARIAHETARLDPSRPVDHASGWHDQGGGDLRSLHIYFRPVRAPRRADPRVLALTEYGGYIHVIPSHSWGKARTVYRAYPTRAELMSALERLHLREIVPAVVRGLAATVYTQLSDVEEEHNGLVSYDRRVLKVDPERMRRLTDAVRAAASDIPANIPETV